MFFKGFGEAAYGGWLRSGVELPAGFQRVEFEGGTVVLRSRVAEVLLAAGVQDPEAVARTSPAPMRGRGQLGRVELGDGRGVALVRPLRRGGLLGKFIRRLSFDPWRSFSELTVSAEAAARGASVLDVLAAVTCRRPIGYHHGLVTREVQGARDLMRVLREDPLGRPRRQALVAAGRAIRDLHEAGVDHVDLNLKNILLAPDGRAIVIDLDRCRISEHPVPWRVRQRNLIRLLRSWTKLGASHPESVAPRDRLVLARAYARGDRDLMRRLTSAGSRARFVLHRLLWRLFPPRIP
jgi:3-deoxy-D-manno-octulosonic acid kinase